MSFDVEEHVRYRIANTPILEYPFPHQFVTSVFPTDFYAQLLDALPPTEFYRPLAETGTISEQNAYRERLVCDLVDIEEREAERNQGHLFADLAAWLSGDSFRDFLIERYRKHLIKRFGANSRLSLAPNIDARFIRDFSRYHIGPHTDSERKLVSLLFYLPRDESLQHLGTSVYAHVDRSFRCAGGPHYEFGDFKQVTRAPYIPNSLFMFFKTDLAFHGVEPITDENVERNLLLYNIYVNKVVTAPEQKPGWKLWRNSPKANAR